MATDHQQKNDLTERATGLSRKNSEGDRKEKSKDSPEIPDRRRTSDVTTLLLGDSLTKSKAGQANVNPKSRRAAAGLAGNTALACMTVCTGVVGKQLHTLYSHPTLGEPQGF